MTSLHKIPMQCKNIPRVKIQGTAEILTMDYWHLGHELNSIHDLIT